MQIVMVAAEVGPFSKEGGLADVLGSLPAALAALGEQVCVISPLYRGVRAMGERLGLPLEPVRSRPFTVPIGDADVPAAAWQCTLPDTDVTAYFLENDRYYDRDGYYTKPANHSDYQDNSERFIFLSRGALELCKAVGLQPDIFHSHDWPTGLVPVYLKHLYEADFPETASVFTIHNISYQGLFWHWDMNLAGLPWSLFTWQMLEYYGNLSFLKAGLVCADKLTTVSKRYAQEIQTEQYGCGMHGVLQERSADLHGIVNGIDTARWNPSGDPLIPAGYSAEDLSGKAECKRALQERFGLRAQADVPLIGMVCRLVDQKGLDLLEEALPSLLEHDVQFVLLGTGEPRYQAFLGQMHSSHPRSCGVLLEYNDRAAHLVEAGSDMFLMPSRFEPCGLNQLYSLRYGTVPVVRATGGLADTVTDYTEEGLRSGRATGFCFEQYSAAALLEALTQALEVYGEQDNWRRLVLNGMRQDWSWRRSAAEYVEVYRKALQKLPHGVST
ncbi:MAG: glycogen synthase GlgA [Candidatus Brocadiae bacterium]|nr:glycogen synthase GlgA [Candidatus Brocadiia bacterium]